ncbi:hypothetical protein [Lapillicoccus sp.]|uniref:hypothetical protein n=1 Tax=Lapillicoccus sp. TaxID=1909287 RepID=UPI00398308E0
MDDPTRPLTVSGCRSECAWSATGDVLGGDPVFDCSACGSEWVRSEPWTPIDAQGEVPDSVLAERRRT